jgi:hypothetical protein
MNKVERLLDTLGRDHPVLSKVTPKMIIESK